MASNHTASRLKPNMFITIEFTTLYTETRKGPRLSYVYIPIVHPLREGDKKNLCKQIFSDPHPHGGGSSGSSKLKKRAEMETGWK